jgi:hypothetical protein
MLVTVLVHVILVVSRFICLKCINYRPVRESTLGLLLNATLPVTKRTVAM